MSLPHALLGMISYKPATGYDLKAVFKESVYYFWNATLPQIYRTLNQLESTGWLTSSMEHQDGKPSRKVYEITEEGKAEFLRWLAEPPEMGQPKQPLLMKVFFGRRLPKTVLAEHIRRYRERHALLLSRYDSDVEPLVREKAAKLKAPEEALYWSLALDFGKRHARMMCEWCDKALEELMRPDGPDHKETGRP